MDPVRPDYEGLSVVSVVAALDGRSPVPWMPEVVKGAASVVLLVLDGLGWSSVVAHREHLPVVSSLEGRAITTVAPATTATGLTSITTGLPPSRHGILGYRMRVDGGVLNVLQWRLPGGQRRPDPVAIQPHQAFGGRPVPVVTRGEFRSGGFTEAHMRGSQVYGWRVPSTLVEYCRLLVEQGAPFVYAYYDGVDQVAHQQGIADRFFEAELEAVDRVVTELLHCLPESCALVITSDHGQVQLGPEGWVSLAPLASLVAAYAGDGRFRSLHAVPGAEADLAAAAREHFDSVAWVFTRDQLLDEGWLGPGIPSAAVRERVGDVVLAAREPVAFIDPTAKEEKGMLAGHGSLTPDEMYVPLLAGRGRGKGTA